MRPVEIRGQSFFAQPLENNGLLIDRTHLDTIRVLHVNAQGVPFKESHLPEVKKVFGRVFSHDGKYAAVAQRGIVWICRCTVKDLPPKNRIR